MQPWMELSTMPLGAEQLYWSRPSVELMKAFNMATYTLATQKKPVLAVMSSSLYAVEIMKRASFSLALAGTGTFDPQIFLEHMTAWVWGEAQPVNLADNSNPYHSILWAEPKIDSAENIIGRLDQLAARGCDLGIITTRKWDKILPWRHKSGDLIMGKSTGKIDPPNLSQWMVERLLKRHGWIVDAIIPFGGLRAAIWQRFIELSQHFNQLYWSDRCSQMMRCQMREPRWLWPLARLALIRAHWK